MKKWRIILSSLLALLILTAVPTAVFAQSEDSNNAAAKPAFKGALAIVAPWTVRVSEEMSLAVFVRADQEPASDAGVWAVTRDKVDTVKQAVKVLREKSGANASDQDYQAILDANGVLLGRTNDSGKLTYTFNDTGNYLLVAVKAGYIPGFSGLAVREVLAITAPKKAAPGETATVAVHQRGTSDPVTDAGVWAVAWSDAKALKDKLAELRTANKGNLQNADWESVLNAQAISLGKTDQNGQASTTFDKAGRYLLITAKKGCVPAFAGIAIVAPKPTPSPTTPSSTTPNPNGTTY